MKAKHLLPLLLAALMILPLLAACGDTAPQTTSGGPSVTDNAAATVDETEAADPDMPEETADYGGASFRVIYPTHANFAYQSVDAETGDSVEDALYRRDQTVSEMLNVAFTYTVTDSINDVYPKVSASVLAGESSYDLVLNHINMELTSYIADQIVLDWYKVPNVDLSKPYWNQNMNYSLAIDDVLPVAASDYVIADPLVLFYNTELAASFGLGDLYGRVDNGSWTWDALIADSAAVVSDIDGDGTMTADDRYGFVVDISGSSYMLRSIPSSAGQYSYVKSADGRLECAANSERMQGMLEKMAVIFGKGGSGLLLKYGSPCDIPTQVAYFGNGNYLYYLVDSLNSAAYRGIEFEYGILPLPKYDEQQESYYSLNWSGLMLVPVTAADPAMTGMVVQWLSYYSRKDVQPEFFSTMMDEKVARDSRSRDMLALVFSTLVYDPAMNYKSPGFYGFFDSMVMSGKTDLASYYAGKESSELSYIEKLNGYFAAFKD